MIAFLSEIRCNLKNKILEIHYILKPNMSIPVCLWVVAPMGQNGKNSAAGTKALDAAFHSVSRCGAVTSLFCISFTMSLKYVYLLYLNDCGTHGQTKASEKGRAA